MKRESLMIGDWVYVLHNGRASHNGKVEAIYESGTISVELEEAGCLCRAESLEPIPLTAEILEKNGFVEKDFYSELIVGDFRIMCDTSNIAILHREHTNLDTPIYYIHELQHALRLCGISKEIVP